MSKRGILKFNYEFNTVIKAKPIIKIFNNNSKIKMSFSNNSKKRNITYEDELLQQFGKIEEKNIKHINII